jgi:NAD(P)-dependent dehydrogenase (short-subunit alcohol dehydrogenase family)
MEDMDGRVALVTGAGSGIGRATALAFAQRGARVVVADIDDEGAAETIKFAGAAGAESSSFHVDVADSAQVQAMVGHALATYGRLDFAVNNAGIGGPLLDTADYAEDAWHRLLSINLTGVFLCLKFEIPALLANGGGAIVNMASVMGHVGMRGGAAYVASKHGVVGLTKVAALEYGGRGIRVSAVCPGFIATPLLDQGGIVEGTEVYAALSGLHALGRMGRPEEVAAAAVWLCSDEASFVSGVPMLVDGGYAAQ